MARMSDCPSPLGTICVDLDCPLHYPYGLEKHRHDADGPHEGTEKNPRNVTCGICIKWRRDNGNVAREI